MSFDKLADRPNLYADVKEFNLIEKIEPLLRAGFKFRKEDGKITADMSYVYDTPWITVRRDFNRECMLWHQILFRYMDVVPSFCLNCWKVVVRPNTIDELFRMHDMMMEWDRSSKCGIEVRAYVQSLYGCYFYNNSLEEGKECLEFVKEQVHTRLNPEIDVHLKRYCTEFELKHGDSDKFEQRPEDKIWEEVVKDAFALDQFPLSADPPEIIKQHIIMKIMEYAAKMKDKSVQAYNNGEKLMPHIVKYDKYSKDPGLRAVAAGDSRDGGNR